MAKNQSNWTITADQIRSIRNSLNKREFNFVMAHRPGNYPMYYEGEKALHDHLMSQRKLSQDEINSMVMVLRTIVKRTLTKFTKSL